MNKEICPVIIPPETEKTKAYKNKIAFIEGALVEGAHLRLPVGSRLSVEQWQRRVDIGLVYNLNETITAEEIGKKLGVSRERVRQLNVEFIQYLWGNCSVELQTRFPLEKIPFDKPPSQVYKEEKSRLMGGISLKVKDQIASNINSLTEIEERTGLSKRTISNTRKTLSGWGIILPRETEEHK